MSVCPTLRCPCEERSLEPAFQYQSPPAGETPFDFGQQPYVRGYDRCTTCGHWFSRHDLDLSRLYVHDYVETTYGGPEDMRRRFEKIVALPPQRSDNRERVGRFLAFAREQGFDEKSRARPRLLDVGAGLGVFPAAMTEAGWQATALESDVRTVTHLREIAGVDAHAISLLDLEATFGTYDAITFNKVLEHVEDPVALLAAGRSRLAKQGFVYLEVPDVAAAVDGPGREEFFIEHHHVFSIASLAMLGERSGFFVSRLFRLIQPSGKYTLAVFMTKAE